MSKPIPENLINELLSIEAYAEQLRQRCYNARKSLERFYAPAPNGLKRKTSSFDQIQKVLAKRRATVIRSLN